MLTEYGDKYLSSNKDAYPLVSTHRDEKKVKLEFRNRIIYGLTEVGFFDGIVHEHCPSHEKNRKLQNPECRR